MQISEMPSAARLLPPVVEKPAVQVTGLTKRYGERAAVDDLSFTLHAGRVTGFLGPNGAGKTTTIRMLLGLAAPTSGKITVFGEPSTAPERYLDRVGALIEGPAFIGALSARENLKMYAALGGYGPRVSEVIERVGLGGREDDAVRDYSLGMKQRLGIAAALLPDPDLLVLDEPTNGLDPAGIQEVRLLLREFAAEGRTVFVSSHLLTEVETICDDLLVIAKGRRLYGGTVRGLLETRRTALRLRPESAGELPVLERLLARHGIGSEPATGGEFIVELTEEWTPSMVNRLAHAEGISLAELHLEQPDLEATFLEMTAAEASS